MFSNRLARRDGAAYFSLAAAVLLIILVLPRVSFAAQSFTTGQAASIVIGQKNFISVNGTAAGSHLYYPRGFAFDAQGNLWVADAYHNRVLEFLKGSGFVTGESASLVIGQTDLSANVTATTAKGLSYPWAVAFDSSGNLWVSDDHNARILEYLKGSGFVSGQSAALVIGQRNFTSGACVENPPTAATLCDPEYLAFDSSGNLWVSDGENNRVLEYLRGAGFASGQAASLVIGQPNLTTQLYGATASRLQEAAGIAFDASGNLWVADLTNNRILEFLKGTGFTSDESASLVLGQAGFTSKGNSTTATGLYWPWDVAFDSLGNLWATDGINNRILEYMKGSGFTSGQAASVVLGQLSFTSKVAGLSAVGLNYPNGLGFDSKGDLWVSDSANGRILSYVGTAILTTQTTSSTSSTSVSSTSETTTSTTSSSTHSSESSTTSSGPSSTSASTSSGSGGGIPEFPAVAGLPLVLTVFVIVSYLLIRKSTRRQV